MAKPSGAVALLYVGDDPTVATGAKDADGRFIVERVPGADAALERIAAGGIDCVLVDPDSRSGMSVSPSQRPVSMIRVVSVPTAGVMQSPGMVIRSDAMRVI